MTGLIPEKEFSRRGFLKGGGALIVGFAAVGSAFEGKAAAAAPTAAGYLPDINKVDSWLAVNADNTVTLMTTQPEVGQGTWSDLLMVAAEELDMDLQARCKWRESTHVPQCQLGRRRRLRVDLGRGGDARSRSRRRRGGDDGLGLASTQLGVPAACASLTVSKERRLGRQQESSPTAHSSAVSSSERPSERRSTPGRGACKAGQRLHHHRHLGGTRRGPPRR